MELRCAAHVAERDDSPPTPRPRHGAGRGLAPLCAALLAASICLSGCGEAPAPAESGSQRALPTPPSPAPALGAAAEIGPPSSSPRRTTRTGSPNLVLITLDTTRADALGAYGQRLPTTPNLDRLASEGVLFEHVVTSNPETLPAHATLFTGKWPFAHGVRANLGYVLSDRHETLAEILRAEGHRTSAEVAAPVLRSETQITQGFESYRGTDSPGVELKKIVLEGGDHQPVTEQVRVAADISRRGIEFMRRHADQGFFLWLHYFDAHNPYVAPPSFRSKIPQSQYHAEVAGVDHQVGLVIAAIEQLGLRDDTLVVITSDHGEGLSEHEEPTHSYFVYDTTMRVPLILWGLEQLPEDRRVTSLVRTADVLPTVLDLLSLEARPDLEGVSLVPLISGQAQDLSLTGYGEATRFLATFGLPTLRFVREENWKYIHKVNPELYDVVQDPGELKNLAAEQPEIVARLRSRLEALVRAAPPKHADAQAQVDAETASRLIALGYAARVPGEALDDEVAALALSGEDPLGKTKDIEILSITAALIQQGQYERALARVLPAKQRNPESPWVLGMYADALIGLGNDAEALPVLQQIMQSEPDNVGRGVDLAGVLERQGKLDEAIDTLVRMSRREPCDESVLLEFNRILRDHRRFDRLIEVLGAAASTCPAIVSNLNNYAWALATLPDPSLRDGQEAVRVARAALERLGKQDPSYLDTLAAALAESGEHEEAARVASDAISRAQLDGTSPAFVAVLREHRERFFARQSVRDPAG